MCVSVCVWIMKVGTSFLHFTDLLVCKNLFFLEDESMPGPQTIIVSDWLVYELTQKKSSPPPHPLFS